MRKYIDCQIDLIFIIKCYIQQQLPVDSHLPKTKNKMDLQLKNKKALITGSTAGIGYAIAKQLAKENAQVYINGRTGERVDAAIKKLKEETGNQDIHGLVADFSNSKDVENLIQQLPEVDILINNIGIFEPKAFRDIPDADWMKYADIVYQDINFG